MTPASVFGLPTSYFKTSHFHHFIIHHSSFIIRHLNWPIEVSSSASYFVLPTSYFQTSHFVLPKRLSRRASDSCWIKVLKSTPHNDASFGLRSSNFVLQNFPLPPLHYSSFDIHHSTFKLTYWSFIVNFQLPTSYFPFLLPTSKTHSPPGKASEYLFHQAFPVGQFR